MYSKIISSIKNYWQYLLFLLLIVIFFQPFFLKGNIPIPLDIPTGMYYPWLNENYGYPVKVPVKNPLLTDTISQFWIWRNWAVEGLKVGEIRIWNPMSLAGYEMSPWFHTITFSPLNLFYFISSRVNAMSLIVISQVLISLFSSFLFAKRFFSQKLLAVYFSVIWTFSSFFIGWLTWGTVSQSLASLPLILYFAIGGRLSFQKPQKVLLYFLSFCLFLLSGHPQTIVYSLFIWACFVVWKSYKSKAVNLFLKHLTIFFLTITFLSPILLPSIKIVSSSIRSADTQLNSVNFGLIPLSKVIALNLSPNFFGNPSTGNYFGEGYNFQEKLVYFGVVPLFLSVLSLINFFYSKKKDTFVIYGLFFAIFGLLISTENVVGRLVYLIGVPLLSTSPAGRGMVIFIFGASILSVCGLSLFNKKVFPKKSFFLSLLTLLFCYIFCFAIIFFAFRVFNQSPPSLTASYQPLKLNYITLLRNLTLSFIFFSAASAGLLIYLFFNHLKLITILVIFVLTLADSYFFFKKYTPFTPPHLYFPETSSLKFLKSKLSPTEIFRVERQSGEVMPPNMWEPFGLKSLSGYDPMANKAYESYLINSKIIPNYSRYVELGQKLDSIDMLGVKYFIVLKRNNQGIIDEKGEHPYYIDHSKWQEVASEGPVSILENKNFSPPYKATEPNSHTKLLSYNETNFLFEVDTENDTDFVFYQNQNSNWQAKVNGRTTAIEPLNGTFFKVPVTKGKNTIEIFYKNREFELGKQLSLISLIILIFVIFKSKV